MANLSKSRTGSSAYRGIYWHAGHGRWLVERHVHVGEFATLEEAFAAYQKAFGGPPTIRRPRRLPVAQNPTAYEPHAPPAPAAANDPRFARRPTRISGEPGGRGSFVVPSRAFPGESWAVEWVGGGACWCGCPAFARTQTCRHAEAVARAVEVEARALAAARTPEQRARAAARLAQIEEEFAR